ncbi:heavy metal translocatin [Sparassis latifolia]
MRCCLDLLARAICADDAGHLHDVTNLDQAPQGTGPIADCSSCCEHQKDCSQKRMPSAGNEASTGCTYTGLRKRSAKHDDSHSESHYPTEACGEHTSIARSRYHDTLSAFGCICKAMLAHGLQSCCSTSTATEAAGVSASRTVRLPRFSYPPASTKSRQSVGSCCRGSSGDCNGGKNSIKSKSRSRVSIDSCCADSHCGGGDRSQYGHDVEVDKSTNIEVSVLEKGVGGVTEHAVIAIKGMTCTGCENKVIRTLHGIPTISNVKTSLVLCRAEFDFDGAALGLQVLVGIVEKRTGFSVEVIAGASMHELRLNVDRAFCDQLLAMGRPDGVEDVLRVDKDTIRISYDPKLVGARSIMDWYAFCSPTFAPEPRDPALSAGSKHIRSLALRTTCSAALTIPVLVMAWAPLPPRSHAYALASLVLATIVQVAITGPVYFSAFKSLFFSRLVETDMLIVLSTTAAYVYSVVAFAFLMLDRPLSSGEFFETSTLLVTLIMLGRLVSAYARQRAMEAISIRSLQSKDAIIMHPDGREERMDARLLQYGDIFKVMPDSSIITDGTVCVGQSEVDESMMTGESRAVEKSSGSTVIAGTLNGPSTLLVEVTRLPGENTITDIASMVDDARFSRAQVQATVDRICGWFVPVVVGIALVTFFVWLAVGIAVRRQRHSEAAVAALTYAIAVLAISCPCAIGLAVPMVVLIAGGVAARLGLVFKAATTIEGARKISHVVFDKTGTLTLGRLAVVSCDVFDASAENIDVRAAIIELVASSRHPVARAVGTYLVEAGVNGDVKVGDAEMVTGRGMQGVLAGKPLRGGSACWLDVEDHPVVKPLLLKGLTTFCVMHGDRLVAAFGLEDTMRPESLFVVDTLCKRGIRISVLSGDHATAVEKVASALNVPSDCVRSACLPETKQAYIKELHAAGEKVLFCGDGTNDAVALAQADIGVHLHTGEGAGFAASTAADVVLTHPSLMGILFLFELSEAVARRIMLNFAWSAVYNLIAILFAAGAFVKARIAPAYAGLGEIVSVLPVVLVALQLKWFKSRV